MKTLASRIIVEVDMDQKLFDSGFQRALEYEGNYRKRHPVMCTVIEGNAMVKKGLKLLCHHNFFYKDSPFRLGGNMFTLKLNESIFARIDDNGNPHSMFGNVMAERVLIESDFDLTSAKEQYHHDRVRVISDGCGYRKGQIILTNNFADYEIVYNWKGEERRVIKVWKEFIVGVLKP
jgi:hypothetical protein